MQLRIINSPQHHAHLEGLLLSHRHHPRLLPLPASLPFLPAFRCSSDGGGRRRQQRRGGEEGVKVKTKAKENIWSVDNDLAADSEEKRRKRRTRRGRMVGRKGRNSRVLVSGPMLMEIETVLQTQEPVIKPIWDTFASSICGIWKGVGAVFSPLTAEIEPIGLGKKGENLYDCYTLSCIEKEGPSDGMFCQIHRKTNWIALNPFGDVQLKNQKSGNNRDKNGHLLLKQGSSRSRELPRYECLDFVNSEMEEDFLSMEPGLVFFETMHGLSFLLVVEHTTSYLGGSGRNLYHSKILKGVYRLEDGSYSSGPLEIPVGKFDESKYFLSPTFKFEQCLVKGCHKRLRIMHTIEFTEGGSNIQIIRVAVYEEQLDSPVNMLGLGDAQFNLKPLSQCKRTQPSELAGAWKVLEMSATPIFSEEMQGQESGFPFVYLCMETLKKRSLPETQVCFGEEEMVDMQDVTMLWLPGGVTAYVDVNEDGTLCIGVGWYSDEGINLVMERDYGMDGKLKDVRWKSEAKRRWNHPLSL